MCWSIRMLKLNLNLDIECDGFSDTSCFLCISNAESEVSGEFVFKREKEIVVWRRGLVG